jgi:16S rRNA (guanine966-N2)-methyltransferase
VVKEKIMGLIRIIAGKWRGRKIKVFDGGGSSGGSGGSGGGGRCGGGRGEGGARNRSRVARGTIAGAAHSLRPTPNAVRETLFNWLAPVIHGARCLDLFAGSGALSFEALSRGAAYVAMFDSSRQAIKTLQENARLLGAGEESVMIRFASMPQQLAAIPRFLAAVSSSTPVLPNTPLKFDIVFLDPPFNRGLLAPTLQQLAHPDLLADAALIYIEMEKGLNIKEILPPGWEMLRHKTLGVAAYCLVQRRAVAHRLLSSAS